MAAGGLHGRRGRRVVPIAAAAGLGTVTALLGLGHATGALAAPDCKVTLTPGQTAHISGETTPDQFTLCVSGVTAAKAQGLLLSVTAAPGAKDSIQLEIDRGSDGTYLRSSRIPGNGVAERVALSGPTESTYQVNVTSPVVAAQGLEVVDGGVGFGATLSLTAVPAAPVAKFGPTVSLPTSGDGEPSIAVDRQRGNVMFVTAPVGVPSEVNPISTGNGTGGVDYWRSTNGGATWAYQNLSLGDGGGDSHVAVDGAGDVFVADLAATDVNLLRSTDEGKTFSLLPPVANTSSDREWLAPYAPKPSTGSSGTTLYLGYHDFAAQELWQCVGPGGGVISIGCLPVVPQNDPGLVAQAATNTITGPEIVVPPNVKAPKGVPGPGTLYQIFGTSTVPENAANETTGPIDNLFMGVSPDGVNWSAYPIVSLPTGDSATNIFPVAAVDSAGTVYAAWSQQNVGKSGTPAGRITLYLSHSKDGGRHWSHPVVVNTPKNLNSAVLPWLAAWGPGQLDVTYVASSTTNNPLDAGATWYEELAQSTNADSAMPAFDTSPVSAAPVRYGEVCVSGIDCTTQGDDGRSLLDFQSVDLTSGGCAAVAIPSSAYEAVYPSGSSMLTQTRVAVQTKGCFGPLTRPH